MSADAMSADPTVTDFDFAQARRLMVDGQIRTNDVTETRLIDALLALPRERFVPQARRPLAYLDDDITLTNGAGPHRYLLEPLTLARLVQAAALKPADRVLDVGAATGYSSAVMARLAGEVFALEEDRALADAADEALADLAVTNVRVVRGALAGGHAPGAPYDAIVLQGSVDAVPAPFFEQLRDGGRLVAIVGRGRAAPALVHIRVGDEITARPVFDVAAPALPGFQRPPTFTF